MALLIYSLRTALHHMRRGGQRVIVAVLCIAFGVMSVVSMTLLSDAIEAMMVVTPQELIGADVTMNRRVENNIFPEAMAGLQVLRQQGHIDQMTLIAFTSSLVYRTPDSGELNYPFNGMGIDPSNYPLLGAFTIGEPASMGAGTLLQEPGDVLITRDLAADDHLHVGDPLLLSDLSVGAVVEGRIRGIVSETPNHQGSKVYYDMDTARLLAGSENPENTAVVTSPDPQALIDVAGAQGWDAYSAVKLAETDEQVQQMFELSLKGAGILGMLVGGIGIANTMQVLLQRRRREVAVLKSIGYRQSELQLLFAVEALLLGVLGSLVGAGLGVAISYGLVGLFSRITTLLISWTFTPLPLLTGVLVGVITTLSFSMFAIIATSQVSPLALLRSEALQASRIPRLQSAGIALLCGLPFVAVTSLIMGSLLKGIGLLLVALAGLTGLGIFLGGLIWLVTRLLPLRAWPLVHMAQNSLRRRGLGLVFAMIALFVGVVSLAAGLVVTTSAQRAMDERLIDFEGDNLTIIAPTAQEAALRQAIAADPRISHAVTGYQTNVRAVRDPGHPENTFSPVLIGREEPGDYAISGAEWGSQSGGVYLSSLDDMPASGEIEVTLMDGSVRRLPVVGTYWVEFQSARPIPTLGILMPTALSLEIAAPDTLQTSLTVPASQVKQATTDLGAALPGATVINLPAYAARFTQAYRNLFVFAVAMASLAILAGILLVANSVSLAMLDRRYEIGVLKAVGYARRQVLFTLVVEYSLVALIATGAGLLVVQIFLTLVAMMNNLAGSLLVMSPIAAGAILLSGVGLTLLTVLAVTWRPVQVSPVVVLNDRD